MPSSDYVQVPREWVEKLKVADGDTGIDLIEQLQSGHIPVFDGALVDDSHLTPGFFDGIPSLREKGDSDQDQ